MSVQRSTARDHLFHDGVPLLPVARQKPQLFIAWCFAGYGMRLHAPLTSPTSFIRKTPAGLPGNVGQTGILNMYNKKHQTESGNIFLTNLIPGQVFHLLCDGNMKLFYKSVVFEKFLIFKKVNF